MNRSQARLYAADLAMQGLPEPLPEHRFHPARRWRFDFAWPRYHVALEVEGGIFSGAQTGHRSINGMKRDIEKYNEAIRYGWYVLRVTPEGLYRAQTYELLRTVLTNRGWMPIRRPTTPTKQCEANQRMKLVAKNSPNPKSEARPRPAPVQRRA